MNIYKYFWVFNELHAYKANADLAVFGWENKETVREVYTVLSDEDAQPFINLEETHAPLLYTLEQAETYLREENS